VGRQEVGDPLYGTLFELAREEFALAVGVGDPPEFGVVVLEEVREGEEGDVDIGVAAVLPVSLDGRAPAGECVGPDRRTQAVFSVYKLYTDT